jgi:hypothetical protein
MRCWALGGAVACPGVSWSKVYHGSEVCDGKSAEWSWSGSGSVVCVGAVLAVSMACVLAAAVAGDGGKSVISGCAFECGLSWSGRVLLIPLFNQKWGAWYTGWWGLVPPRMEHAACGGFDGTAVFPIGRAAPQADLAACGMSPTAGSLCVVRLGCFPFVLGWRCVHKGLCFAVAAGRAGGMMRSACRVAGKKEARVSARAWFVVHDVGVGIDR